MRLAFLLAALGTDTTPPPADSVPPTAPSATSAGCFLPRPLPRCRSFVVTEVGYFASVLGTPADNPYAGGRRALDSHVSWELGYMRNRDDGTAVGGVLLVGGDHRGARVGAKIRGRRWLARRSTLDVGAGVVSAGVLVPEPSYAGRGVGPTADVSLGWRDIAALSLRADAIRTSGRTSVGVYGGARLGGVPALAATAAAAVGVAVLVALLAGNQ